MSTQNEWTFIGNLGKDAEIMQLENGQLLVFSVAIDRSYYDKYQQQRVDKTQWVECSQMYPKDKAVKLADYLKKGCKVQVDGVPYPRAWVDKEGNAHANQNVSVKSVQPLTWPEKNRQSNADNSSIGLGDDDDEDLPF